MFDKDGKPALRYKAISSAEMADKLLAGFPLDERTRRILDTQTIPPAYGNSPIQMLEPLPNATTLLEMVEHFEAEIRKTICDCPSCRKLKF